MSYEPVDHDEYLIALRNLVASRVWQAVLRPAFERQRLGVMQKLVNPSDARKANHPDDYLRGQIATLAWIETFPEREIARAKRSEAVDDDVDGDIMSL